MTTLRDRRHQRCLNTIARLTEQREQAFRRLAIILNKLSDERRRLKRLEKDVGRPKPMPKDWAKPPALEPYTHIPDPTPIPKAAPVDSGDVDLEIPEFLWRGGKRPKADIEARAQIEAEQAERKKAKAKARIDKLKAKQRGDLKKMPLSGKAALKYIREG